MRASMAQSAGSQGGLLATISSKTVLRRSMKPRSYRSRKRQHTGNSITTARWEVACEALLQTLGRAPEHFQCNALHRRSTTIENYRIGKCIHWRDLISTAVWEVVREVLQGMLGAERDMRSGGHRDSERPQGYYFKDREYGM